MGKARLHFPFRKTNNFFIVSDVGQVGMQLHLLWILRTASLPMRLSSLLNVRALKLIPLLVMDSTDSRPRNEFKHMVEAHSLAANFYSHLLLNTVEGEKALDYLENRGFTRASIEKYGIGWSLDDFEALSDLLKKKRF